MLIIFTRLIAIKIYVAFATVKAVSTHTEHGRCLFVICFCMWSFVTTQCGQTSVIFWTTFAGISRPFVNTFMLLFLLFSLEWAIAIFAIIFHLTFGTCSIKMSCATDLTCWRFCYICLDAGSVDWCEGFTYWLNWFRTSLPVLLELWPHYGVAVTTFGRIVYRVLSRDALVSFFPFMLRFDHSFGCFRAPTMWYI